MKQKILSNENIPISIREKVAHTAGKVASDVVTAQQVAQKMGAKMCKEIPKKLLEKGITVEAEQVFHEGVLLVLQLQVTHVDAVVLVKARAKAAESTCVSWLQGMLCMIGTGNRDALENDYLPTYVTSKLTECLKPAMERKLLEKNLKAAADIMSETRQARFFFHLLKELREAKEAEKQEKRKAGPKLLTNLVKRKESDIPLDGSTNAESRIPANPAASNSPPIAKKGPFGGGKGPFGKVPFGKKKASNVV